MYLLKCVLEKINCAVVGVIVFLLLSHSAYADHATAGNITYKCVGKDSFEITLTFYRDCNTNIDLPSTASIKVQSGSTLLKTLTVNLQSKTDVTPICDTSLSRCAKLSSSVPFGFKKFIYKGIVQLAYGTSQYCDIKFSYTLCCRGWVNPNADFYVESNMNRCKSKCNSSPIFEYDPIFVVTTGQDVRLYQSASDEDGDSLVYLLTPPSAGPVSNLTIPSGVTYLKPFGQFVPFNYDTVSGLVSFKPSNTGSGLVAYKVEEWGKDSSGNAFKKGEIIRDALTTVQNGSNKSPVISDIDGGKKDEITICADVNSCFSISSYDLNTSDIVELNWDNAISGAVFSTTKGRNAKAIFCWKPSINQVRAAPYILTVTAKDNICPVPAITQKKFKVYVKPAFPKFSYTKKQLSCAYYQFQIQSNKNDNIKNKWLVNNDTLSSDSVFIYRFPNNGTYILRNILAAPGAECNPFIIDTFLIINLPSVSAGSPVTICYGDSTQLSGSGGIKYNWSPNTGLSNANIANPFAFPKTTTTYTLTVEDANGCQKTSSVKITVLKPALTVSSDTSMCEGSKIQLKASGGVLYSWTPATGLSNSNIAKPFANPKVTTTYYVTVEDTTGCKLTDSVKVIVNKPNVTISPDATICLGDNSQIFASGGVSYSWFPATGLSNANISNPFAFPKQTTTYSVTITDINGCQVIKKVTVNVNKASVTVASPVFICKGDSIKISASGGISYKWMPGLGLSDPNISDPIAKPLVTTNYVVFVKDTNGCTALDSVLVNVDNNCVWPGDVDYNKLVNNQDVLQIGLAYTDTGAARKNSSLAWVAQNADSWSKSFKNGINLKHADCNGDGIVDSIDISVINKNYGLSWKKRGSTAEQAGQNDASLILEFPKDSFQAGDTILMLIKLGTSEIPAKDVYGLAFSFTFDPALVEKGTFSLNLSNSWLNVSGKDLISLNKEFHENGSADIAISRTNKKNVSGFGAIGMVSFVLTRDLGSASLISKPLITELQDILAISGNEDTILLNSFGDTLIAYKKTSSLENTKALENIYIRLYPNPFSNFTTFEYVLQQREQVAISIFDLTGKEVSVVQKGIQNEGKYSYNIDADKHQLKAGIYILKVVAGSRVITRQLVKVKE